jgi:biotin carboxyl carrier protein
MKFFATSEHKSYEFTIERHASGFTVIDSEGNRSEASLTKIENHRYSLLLNNESFIVNAEKTDKQYTTIIRGKQFELSIDDEKSKAWKLLLEKSGAGSSDATLKAPMPGLVVKFLVEEGQAVEKGDPVLVLSAMKMENEIKASSAGIVSRIHCKENVAVEKNDILISFE